MQEHDPNWTNLKRSFLALTVAEQRAALEAICRILADMPETRGRWQVERGKLLGVTTFDPDGEPNRN